MWDLGNNAFFCYLSFVVGNMLGAIGPVHEYYQLYFSVVQSSGIAETESVLHLFLTIFLC